MRFYTFKLKVKVWKLAICLLHKTDSSPAALYNLGSGS